MKMGLDRIAIHLYRVAQNKPDSTFQPSSQKFA